MADLSTGVLNCDVPLDPTTGKSVIEITDKFVIEQEKESGSIWMEQLDKAYYPFFYAAKIIEESTEVKPESTEVNFSGLEDFHRCVL